MGELFSPRSSWQSYRAVDQHTRKQLRQWLCAKHQGAWPETGRFPTASFYKVFGLVRLTERTASLPWANRELSPERRMREIRTSGAMSGNRKQSQVKPDCGGDAKAEPTATGRLQPLCLFSTPVRARCSEPNA
jgi:hypothetical protein